MQPNKLPVLGGGERELRDGDRVRLRCGIDITIVRYLDPKSGADWSDGYGTHYWRPDGTVLVGTECPYDIVLILGPESVDNGDGTGSVRAVKTLIAEGHPEFVDRLERVIVRDTPTPDWRVDVNQVTAVYRRPPAPSAFEKELARRVKDGEVVLPPRATKMWLHCGDWRFNDGDPSFVEIDWKQLYLGPLPDRTQFPGPDTVSLDVVRELVKGARAS